MGQEVVAASADCFTDGLIPDVGEKRERTLSVQTLTEKLVIDRKDIENVQSSALSLMPDGLLDPLSTEEVRDLFGYLMTSSQP